ncbi:MAG TPA: CopD family protein [Dehalococcoidia bacterium]|nr:CopD family protein [Dehalococcoidia bacterium]
MRKALAALAALAGLALAIGLQAVAPRPVEAHATLVRADPPVNSQLREPPQVMTLYFSEPLERRVSTVRVLDAGRQRLDISVEFDDQDDALMRVRLPALQPGYYTVAWETLSKVDGHRITGQYPITVLNPDGTPPPGSAPQAGTVRVEGTQAKPERVVVRWLLLVGGSLVAGSVAFAWVLLGVSGGEADRVRKAAAGRIAALAAGGLWLLAVAGFAELLLQARDVFGSATDFPDVLGDTRWGERWLARNVLVAPLAFGVFALYRRGLTGRTPRLLTIALLALSLAYLLVTASVSHAAAGRGSVWATLSDFVHLVAASVWIGMLVQVAVTAVWARRNLTRQAQAVVLADVLRRFSIVALISVALLLFTGVVNAVIELNEPGDLLETGYGRALLIKLVLIAPLLVAGALNAYLFRPQVDEEADRVITARRGGLSAGWEELHRTLSRTVAVEAALAVTVLLVVGYLAQVAPPRSALASPSVQGKFIETRSAGGISVTLVVDPNQPGQNAFETYLTGDALSVERVRLVFEQQKRGAFQSDMVLERSSSPLIYVGAGPYLDQAGKWRVTVELRRSAGADLALPFAVEVSAPGGLAAGSRGGAFESPRGFSTEAVLLVAVSGALCAGLVIASLDRPGRPAGLMGDWADRIADVEVRPSLSLAALLAVGIGLGILFGTHGHEILRGESARTGNRVPASPESVARGRELFFANCIQCHGESGRGDGPLASSLSIPPANLYDHIPYHADQFFFNIISRGVSGVMPGFASTLSEEDRWHILNFLRDQFGEGAATR